MNRKASKSIPERRSPPKLRGGSRGKRPTSRAKHPPVLPEVMDCLVQEHRHFRELLDVMAERSRQRGKLGVGDYCLLYDIVSYLHDYPEEIHHPTEDRLFTRLLERDDSRAEEVATLRHDHENIGEETGRLQRELSAAIDDPSAANEKNVRKVCSEFVAHQMKHMVFENDVLFPEAIDRLQPEDWQDIEAYFAAVDDPLFGKVVGKQHRLLYEYLVHPMEEATQKYTTSGISSLERFARTTDVIERGAGAVAQRLQFHRNALSKRSRITLARSVRPESVKSALLLPMEYSLFVGKTVLNCGVDVLRICAETVGQARAIRRE